MTILSQVKRAVIVAPHPDDEVLGCGGTMARLAAMGAEVHVLLMTRGMEPRFSSAQVERVLAEVKEAHAMLGVTRLHCLDLPAAELDAMPIADVNHRVGEILAELQPDTLFLPFIGDIHFDHQVAFTAAMVYARPRSDKAPSRIYAYETLSETNWYAPGVTPAFTPNMFVDISQEIALKLRAFGCFRSQVKAFPDERSLEALEALARMRGATVFRNAAEAYQIIRQID
ncbi:MAG TPA: PIG-L deacetylase family protein [Sphingobium sp.]